MSSSPPLQPRSDEDPPAEPASVGLGSGDLVSVWAVFGADGPAVEKRARSAEGRRAIQAEAARLKVAGARATPPLLGAGPDGAWLRMGRAAGEPLHAWARGRPLAQRRAALGALAAGLADLHRRGLVHGDLKPEHAWVAVGSDGEIDVQMIDLGDGALTQPCFGSPGYAAPEQLGGAPLGPAADAYALGATAWLVLTGAPLPPVLAAPPADPRGPGLALSDPELHLLWALLRPRPSDRPSAAAAAARWAKPGRAQPPLPPSLGRALARWASGVGPLWLRGGASPLAPRLLAAAGAVAAWRGRRLAVRWESRPDLDVLEVVFTKPTSECVRAELPVVAPDQAARCVAAVRAGAVGIGAWARSPAETAALVEALVDLGALCEGPDGALSVGPGLT